jgi:RNA-directed DNA polymerase
VKLFDIGSKDELAKLLLVHPLELEEVSFNRGKLYRSHRIRKANGTLRILHVPQGKLGLLQQKINRHILDGVEHLKCIHGGVKGRSAITNARQHVDKAIVFSLDVKDFFPSISPQIVRAIFEALGFREEAANLLVHATTWDGQLPQGAPTSSAIANLSMTRVDVRLAKLARTQGFDYTRYVDDLTFSGPAHLKKFRRLIQRVVQDEGFKVNPDKIFTMHSGMRQVVTKIVVNTKLNLTREDRKRIRQSALQHAVLPKQTKSSNDCSIRGQLSWLHSVNPTLGMKVRQLAEIP